MSLSVSLHLDTAVARPEGNRIFIRRDGATVEITRAEWDELQPGRVPVSVLAEESDTVYWANITHNLGLMARKAGLYEHLWLAEEKGVTRAGDLIEPLTLGLATLMHDPDQFKVFNPENGWGNYQLLVSFTADYLAACREFPEARVECSR